MSFFRTMEEPESTDITKHPGYVSLSGDDQKKVAETYTNVYNSNQGKLGYRIAQGIAYATAKQMCESLDEIEESSHDQEPDHVCRGCDHGAKGSVVGKRCPKCNTYDWRSAKSAQSKYTKENEAGEGVIGPWMTAAQHERARNSKGTKEMWSDNKVSQADERRKEARKQTKLRTEGDAEDFQAGNDNLVGMTEREKKDPITGMPTRGLEKTGMMQDILKKVRDREEPVKKPVKEDETTTNPEDDGAAQILRKNHSQVCASCGATHPLDVMCFNGRSHSDAGTGAGDILKQNHTAKGMTMEESNPDITAAASYISHRAKVSGIVESTDDNQKKNLNEKYEIKTSVFPHAKVRSTHDTHREAVAHGRKAHPQGFLVNGPRSTTFHGKNFNMSGQDSASHTPLGESEDPSCPECGSGEVSFHPFNFGKSSDTGYSDSGERYHCAGCGSKGDGDDAAPRKKMHEAMEAMWAENYFPAKPLEECCGNCSHPQSYHEKSSCMTCGECLQFSTTMTESTDKTQICYCGHEFGNHGKGGCKSCKNEGVVDSSRASHQFRKNDYKERFEAEYHDIFIAQQGKISTAFANARTIWLPEDFQALDEAQKTNLHSTIAHGDHVTIMSPHGSKLKGKAVMKGPHGWVLNLGGKHGTPGIADEHNTIAVHKAKSKAIKEEASANYHDTLTSHGYKHHETDPEFYSTYKHPNGSHVTVSGRSGNWEHKGKNKKLVSNKGDSPASLNSHLKKVASQATSASKGKERDETMKSLGLNKVKGSHSGKTYWESEEPKKKLPEPDKFDKLPLKDKLDKLEYRPNSVRENLGINAAVNYISQQITKAGGPVTELKQVHSCNKCGFVSTRSSEYVRQDPKTELCKNCHIPKGQVIIPKKDRKPKHKADYMKESSTESTHARAARLHASAAQHAKGSTRVIDRPYKDACEASHATKDPKMASYIRMNTSGSSTGYAPDSGGRVAFHNEMTRMHREADKK